MQNIFYLQRAIFCWVALAFTLGIHSVKGQGTAFGYQGRLNAGGVPVTGVFDFRFTIFDSVGNPSGAISAPVTYNTAGVTNGLFSAVLDFGPGVFTGPPCWLEIAVRTNGGSFTTMTPRQPLLPAPYAILAGTASNVVNGSVVKSLNNLKDNVTLAAGANVTIIPSGNTLTVASAGVGGSGIWSVLNNNTYYNLGGVGIGTTAPTATLDVRGSLTLETGGSATLYTGTGPSELNRYLNLVNSPSSPSASGLKAGGVLVADSYGYANPGKNDLVVKGRIGVGSSTIGNASLNAFGNWDGDDGALTLRGDKPSLRFKGSFISGDISWLMHVGSDGPGNLQFYTRSDLALPAPAWNSVMTMTTDGSVGIGTTVPAATLDINGPARTKGLTINGGPAWTAANWKSSVSLDNGSAISWATNAAGKSVGLGHTTGGTYLFRTASAVGTTTNPPTYDLVVSDAGNVGIGIIDPIHKLDVAGNVNAGGNVTQNQDKSGLVKAMVKVDYAGHIVNCYNSASISSCGITVDRVEDGQYKVNFGFSVAQRFVSITPERQFYFSPLVSNFGANYRADFEENIIYVYTFVADEDEDTYDCGFTLILF